MLRRLPGGVCQFFGGQPGDRDNRHIGRFEMAQHLLAKMLDEPRGILLLHLDKADDDSLARFHQHLQELRRRFIVVTFVGCDVDDNVRQRRTGRKRDRLDTEVADDLYGDARQQLPRRPRYVAREEQRRRLGRRDDLDLDRNVGVGPILCAEDVDVDDRAREPATRRRRLLIPGHRDGHVAEERFAVRRDPDVARRDLRQAQGAVAERPHESTDRTRESAPRGPIGPDIVESPRARGPS